MSQPVLVPLLNANEPEARLVGIHVSDGQNVEKGAVLFTLETTEAAADVEAPVSGFVRILAQEGDTLSVGDRLAMITATLEETMPPLAEVSVSPQPASVTQTGSSTGSGSLRITKPARALAEQLGVDLSNLPTDHLITETVIRQLAQSAAPVPVTQLTNQYSNSHLLIYGAGGHAKSVMEMAQAMGIFEIAGILDDRVNLTGTSVLGIAVLGTREILPQLAGQGLRLAANGVGGILDINVRVKIFDLLESYGFIFPVLKHPRATVEPSATLNEGVQIFANAYVGSSAVLHSKCMINTGAVVSHDCEIGAYTHIAPGALLAGHVHVGERSLVGMGVTTAIGMKIGNGVRIGNGAIIYADVPDKAIVPAGKVWGG